jgi:hypothetical protein
MIISMYYCLDTDAAIGTPFPNVIYNGQISPLVLQGRKQSTKESFPPGSPIEVKIDSEFYLGDIASVPISPTSTHYQITPPDSADLIDALSNTLAASNEPVFSWSSPTEDNDQALPTMPKWIKDDTHVTLITNGLCCYG